MFLDYLSKTAYKIIYLKSSHLIIKLIYIYMQNKNKNPKFHLYHK